MSTNNICFCEEKKKNLVVCEQYINLNKSNVFDKECI